MCNVLRTAWTAVCLGLSLLVTHSLAASAAGCGEDPCERSPSAELHWSLAVDNDVLTGTGNDYGYTGGFRFSVSGERAERLARFNYRMLERLDQWTGFERYHHAPREAPTDATLQLGLIAFTPKDLKNGEPTLDDRPYANLLYLSHSHYALNPEQTVMHQSTFSLGMLGSSVARELQGAIHSASAIYEPRGYGNQISAGGELTGRYAVARSSLLAEGGAGRSYDLKLTLEGSAGYLTEGAVALDLRWGHLGTPWWSGTSQHAEYAAQPAPRALWQEASSGGEFYFLAGAKLRARIYNVFLQGQFRDSKVTFSSSELNPLVLEAWIGVTRQVAAFHISYALRHQTQEIRRGPASKSLTWAGFTISRDFR